MAQHGGIYSLVRECLLNPFRSELSLATKVASLLVMLMLTLERTTTRERSHEPLMENPIVFSLHLIGPIHVVIVSVSFFYWGACQLSRKLNPQRAFGARGVSVKKGFQAVCVNDIMN